MTKSQKVFALAGVSIATVILVVFVLLHSQIGAIKTDATAKPTATTTPTPYPPGTFAEFALPAGFAPEVIITGPDGNLWITDRNQMQIARMTMNGTVTLFQIPSAVAECCINAGGDDIIIGLDGNLWFSEGNARKIGRLTPKGVFTEYPLHLQEPYDAPAAITFGPDGNLWFTYGVGIGRMTLQGDITEFPVPSLETALNGSPIQALPGDIVSGPDGNLWFNESQGDHIGRITMQGNISQFSLPKYTPTYGIVSGSDGNLWFTEGLIHMSIGRITPQGTITTFAVSGSGPSIIIKGLDGNLWFTAGAKIGRITMQGDIVMYPISAFSQTNGPMDITLGPDGNIWMTESNGKIGRFTP